MIDKRLILVVYAAMVLTLPLGFSQTPKIYFLEFQFKDNLLSIYNVSVKEGFPSDVKIQPEDGYRIEVVSFDGDILLTHKFEIPDKIIILPPLSGNESKESEVLLNEVNFSVSVWYFENGKTINIHNPENTKIITTDVSEFAIIQTKPLLGAQQILIISLVVAAAIAVIVIIVRKQKSEWMDSYRKLKGGTQ